MIVAFTYHIPVPYESGATVIFVTVIGLLVALLAEFEPLLLPIIIALIRNNTTTNPTILNITFFETILIQLLTNASKPAIASNTAPEYAEDSDASLTRWH